MYQDESAPWLLFRAWNTDGTPKTDLVYNTTGIALYLIRKNESKGTAIALSDAASASDWGAAKFWQIDGNLYKVGISTASISSYTGVITVQGSYTGGTLDGIAVEVEVVPSTHTAANVYTAFGTGSNLTALATQTSVDDIPTNAEFSAAFPSNFATLGINVSGHVSRVTIVDTTTVNTDMRGTDSAYTGTPPTVVQMRTEIDTNSTQLAAIVATVDDQPTSTQFNEAATRIENIEAMLPTDSTYLAGSSVNTPINGADGDTLETLSDQLDAIGSNVQTLVNRVTTTVVTLWANLTAMITGSGATAAYTTKAMENAPAGGSGGSVNVLPATGIVADRAAGITLTPIVGETISQSITLYQTDGTTAVDVSGKTLAIVFETMSGVDVAVVASGNITISGDDSNVLTFAYPSAVTATERVLRFAIRDAASPLTLYLQGVCSVGTAPRVDT